MWPMVAPKDLEANPWFASLSLREREADTKIFFFCRYPTLTFFFEFEFESWR